MCNSGSGVCAACSSVHRRAVGATEAVDAVLLSPVRLRLQL